MYMSLLSMSLLSMSLLQGCFQMFTQTHKQSCCRIYMFLMCMSIYPCLFYTRLFCACFCSRFVSEDSDTYRSKAVVVNVCFIYICLFCSVVSKYSRQMQKQSCCRTYMFDTHMSLEHMSLLYISF